MSKSAMPHRSLNIIAVSNSKPLRIYREISRQLQKQAFIGLFLSSSEKKNLISYQGCFSHRYNSIDILMTCWFVIFFAYQHNVQKKSMFC